MEINWKAWLFASAILTAAAGTSSTSAFAAAAPSTDVSFNDLTGVSPEQTEAIREAARLGLIKGFPNNEYRPEQALTRQEFAILLVKALELPLASGTTSSFTDVTAASWSVPYIEAARRAGLMNGSGSAFRPQSFVSREEMASVLLRAVNGQNTSGGLTVNSSSIGPVSSWARDSVEAAARLGLIESSFANLNLKGRVTRADIALFLVNIFPEKEVTATVTSVSGDTIMIDGRPLLVTDSLKRLLLGSDNVQALEGAKLMFKTSRHSVGGISEIEIMDSGTAENRLTFNADGFPASGELKISGNHVTVNGSSISNMTLQNSASDIELNANVAKLQVGGAGELKLSGKVNFGELRVTNTNAKLTIGSEVQIERVVLPVNANPASIFTNLPQVTGQIKQAVTTSGTPVNLPGQAAAAQPSVPTPTAAPLSTPAPAPTPTPSDPVIVTPPVDSNRLAVEQDRASLAIGFQAGDDADSVTSSVQLSRMGEQGSAISWISDNESLLSSNGTVTRAVYGSGDSVVTLAATLIKGNVTQSRDFTLTVKAAEFPVTDKAALSAKIRDARLVLEITPVGSDDGQAPENVSVAFASSIRNAEQVIDNRFASQDEINLAEVVLGSAITDFEQVVDGVSTQLLLQKIYDAQALLFNTPVGDRNGSVPEEAKQAFQLSLTSAQGVISDSNSGKQAMIAARIALSQAMDTFNGSKIVVDKKALSGRIDEAAFLLSDLKVGIRQGQVAPVPYQELGTALQAAQATYSDETVSQQTINNRIAELGGKIQALKDSIALTDIEFLRLKIREAELMVQYAVIGTEPWNATVPGVNALTYARLAAIEVSDEPASTATQITAAIDSLTLALAAFEQSRVPELTISLAPNAEFVLNNVTSEKVHISDLEGKNYDKTYQYTKRNILDLVRVKKGDQEQFLKYDAQLGNFKIYDDSNFQKYTGRTLTVTSVSPELRIIAASKGAQISQINLSDNTKAEIEINLIKEGREISDVKLPVTVDHDKPVWTSTVYDPSTTQFTLTSSERVSAPNSNYGQTGGTKSARIDFQYSPKGTFEDGDIVRTSAIPVINGNQLTFLLNPELKKLNRPAGSKFRVILNDITDYAYNEADIQTFDFDAASSGSNPSQP